jgi:L-ascorbate metabolism protein UlaG (beta-lactamase superfamily)
MITAASGRQLADAFEPADQPILEAISAQIEGSTARDQVWMPRPFPRAQAASAMRVGHICFVITSGADTLYFAGDLAHHNIIIENRRMEDVFDTDAQLGTQTRLKTMGMLAAQHAHARLSSAMARPRPLRPTRRRLPLRA